MSESEKHDRFIEMASEASASGAFACIVGPCGQVAVCGPENSRMSIDTTARFVATAMIALDTVLDMVASSTGVPIADVREEVLRHYGRGRLADVTVERNVDPNKD